MAAKVLLAKRATARAAAGLLVGSVALYPSVAFAEGPESRSQPRKSIYDEYDEPPPAAPRSAPAVPSIAAAIPAKIEAAAAPQHQQEQQQQTIYRGPTPTDRLAAQIRRARLFLHGKAAAAEDSVNAAMDRAFSLEQSFTATVASLAPPRESGERLMPGVIYVLVAAMAGTIVSRGRNIVLRAAAPTAFGLGAAYTVLPITMRNVGDLAWKYEQRFPAVADAHIKTREGIERSISLAKTHSRMGIQMVDDKVTETRETIESWVSKGK